MPILSEATGIADRTFDYIVVGGGTAGLALAARLSEDSGVTVLVLEAGESHINDPMVDIPAQQGATFMNPKYDWAFPTIKQKNSNNLAHMWARGKGLGGSSAMNFICWTKPPTADVDAIEKLGNPGWNWAEYQKYSKKSESFLPSVDPQVFDEKSCGTSGPIQVTVPVRAETLDTMFQDTLINKAIKPITDPYSGDIMGSWTSCNNMDEKWKRSYSASGYLFPNAERSNLTVLTGAFVCRLRFADPADSGDELSVSGVEFIHNSEKKAVLASKEVILSAGAIKSPQILELSGIGQPDVLSRIEVETKIDLPGVGENLQEHHFVATTYELDLSTVQHETFDLFTDVDYAEEALRLHAEGKGLHRMGISSFAFLPLSTADPERALEMIKNIENEIKTLTDERAINPSLSKQYDLQLSSLRDSSLPDLELILFPGFFPPRAGSESAKRFISILGALNHPFSRGSIHATTNNPLDNPEIDPNYFAYKFDLDVLIEHVKFIRSMAIIEPFKSGVIKEVVPGPDCSTDEDIAEFVKNTHSTTYHTVGSCSMLPREDLGVVDAELKVYGTKNLRIADLSVIPLHIAAHTQATAYVIGEKAADIIRDARIPKSSL